MGDPTWRPTLSWYVHAVGREGTTVVGDLETGDLQITTFQGEPLDPPPAWRVTHEQFEAELLECADNLRGAAAPTPRDGMPVWGTNFDEWLSDELAIRRGELERRPVLPQEPVGRSN